jgi:hypothetical protein
MDGLAILSLWASRVIGALPWRRPLHVTYDPPRMTRIFGISHRNGTLTVSIKFSLPYPCTLHDTLSSTVLPSPFFVEVGSEEILRKGTERNRQGIPPNRRGTEWNLTHLTGWTSTGWHSRVATNYR